ncbi:MAG: hypothetical protein FRX49_09848 [Trebouxia sp. A1-2]|nr:MAG: hypothetical protein FRX49_09848 [Trebouxia sp. A1-2]
MQTAYHVLLYVLRKLVKLPSWHETLRLPSLRILPLLVHSLEGCDYMRASRHIITTQDIIALQLSHYHRHHRVAPQRFLHSWSHQSSLPTPVLTLSCDQTRGGTGSKYVQEVMVGEGNVLAIVSLFGLEDLLQALWARTLMMPDGSAKTHSFIFSQGEFVARAIAFPSSQLLSGAVGIPARPLLLLTKLKMP